MRSANGVTGSTTVRLNSTGMRIFILLARPGITLSKRMCLAEQHLPALEQAS
jgi:hypothetical protein